MGYEQYWGNNDAEVLKEYIEAERLRRERDNESAWLHGLYVYRAISVALANAFSKKGSQPEKYPERPFDFYQKPKTEEEKQAEAEQEAEAEREKLVTYLNNVRRAQEIKQERK